MSNNEIPPSGGPPRAVRQSTVRLGRRFAGSLASRLDAHPSRGGSEREDEEKRLLAMIRAVMSKVDPDRSTVDFLTSAVEVYTRTFGFSKTLYDELFRLHQQRLDARSQESLPMTRGPARSPVVTSAARPAVPRFDLEKDGAISAPERVARSASPGLTLAIPRRTLKA
jgi:hypothetical protein